jgi:glycosyltransferase involved in cell wall biosynthesis
MRIGFDAKRAFFNRSGLGNYSRDTIHSLFQHFPGNDFFLYTPSTKNALSWKYDNPNLYICTSSKRIGKIGQAYWRSFLLNKRLQSDGIDLYHGLSNELPYHLEKTGIKSVVTIHDLIFMHHPEWYKPVDRLIYRKKFNHSSRIADRVVTVSRQTQHDLVNFFGIEKRKIEVIYQGCNNAFKI